MSAGPSFLPTTALPTSSFADEVEQDIRRREASAGDMDVDDVGLARATSPSIMFPGTRQRSGSTLTGNERNGAVRGSTSTGLPYTQPDYERPASRQAQHDYPTQPAHNVLRKGAGPFGSNKSTLRPTSRPSLPAGHPSRTSLGQLSMGEPTTALDYLYLEEERRKAAAVEAENVARAGRPMSANSRRASHLNGGDLSPDGEIDFASRDGDGDLQVHGQEEEQAAREDMNFSKEEAWYFLRELVGQELRHEEGLLWKMRDLDGRPGSSVDSYDGDEREPQDAPILRYLIRHFLLTLPLVRDTAEDGEIPSFWTDGLHPIIRAVHDADLSKPADRGFVGPVSRLYGSSMRNALERFVSAGLKLSSASHVDPSPDVAGLQRQRSNASSQRSKARSAAMSGVEASAPPAQSGKDRPISSSTSTSIPSSSSWSQRFSFGRLFGSTTATPVKSNPVSVPPPIPTVLEATPSQAPESASETDSDRDAGVRPLEAGRPRPDSAVLPALPFSGAEQSTGEVLAARHTGSASSSRRASTVATRSRPLTPVGDRLGDPEMEELDLSRQVTRTTNVTSAFDAASFVTAGEGTLASRTGHDGESDTGSEADETARFPGSLFFSSAKSGPPPIALDQPSSAPETPTMPATSFEPVSSNGLEPAEMQKEGSSSSGPIEGLEYYGSDAATTPKHEKEGFDLPSAAAVGSAPNMPTGKSRAFDNEEFEPYVVDDAATKLPPPVPAALPYSSPTSSPRQSTSSPRRTLPSSPPLRPISPPQRDRLPTDLSAPPRSKSKFGLGSLLKKTHSRSASSGSSKSPTFTPASLNEVPASRRVPIVSSSPPPRKSEDFVAHMAIPHELLYPTAAESADGHAEDTGAEVPEPVLLPKGGVKWPWDEPVPFLQGPDFEQLKWGGFEADVIGVRKSLFSHSYIIRIRRPGRLDEYVLRTEAQWAKFARNMSKLFPHAHIRRIPPGDPKHDTVIRPKPYLPTIGSAVSVVSGADQHTVPGTPISETPSRAHSRLMGGIRAAAADPTAPPRASRTLTRSSLGSTFARSLRAQSTHTQSHASRRSSRKSRAMTSASTLPPRPHSAAGSYRSYPMSFGSRFAVSAEIGKKMPPFDPRRRALRAWLRDVLSIKVVGHHKETAAFLLLGSIVPRDSDVLDMAKREAIDDARRSARSIEAQRSIEKVRTARKQWSAVEREIIYGDGLGDISEALKTTRSIAGLPPKYQKVLEILRFDLAETLYETLVESETSGTTFTKLKALNTSFPWFFVKQAMRLKSSKLMARALQDLLISRRFGGKSLLQKILAITLDDDPSNLAKVMDLLQVRIGSAVMVEKLNAFVHESREKKAIIRRYAEENQIELVLCIVRGADEPRLPGFELDRVTQAQKSYRKWLRTNPTPYHKTHVKDSDVRLVLDLQAYLTLASRDRDSTILREMLAKQDFAAAVEIVLEPVVQLLKRTYRVGNGAQAVTDLQKFVGQLITVVEALRSRVQDPQKSIRAIARLLERHQQNLYAYLHRVHRKETILEEFLQWAWTASVFLRRGLAQPIDLDDLVPPSSSEDRLFLLEELADLVSYQHDKRLHAFQAAARRYAGDVDADDPIIVEGDGKGRSRLDGVVDPRPTKPVLEEVRFYAEAFRDQLRGVFAV
ncbi:PX domain containing protein [Rhodotorula toruloides]|uniref:PX domain containing protein n=1 Tax=Rhodotorula toruloides TaxID=5286 RepID=A0A511KHK5_RHOTO|nr:PX domain containing protein [Rhodotorula toruloides]